MLLDSLLTELLELILNWMDDEQFPSLLDTPLRNFSFIFLFFIFLLSLSYTQHWYAHLYLIMYVLLISICIYTYMYELLQQFIFIRFIL